MAGPEIKPYKMSAIKSKLLRPALTSNFICKFFPPRNINNFLNYREDAGFVGANLSLENQELIELSCCDASLPGSSLMTHEINNDYTGVTERHAYRRSYDDRADFSFYVDAEYRIIDFFENWISYIIGENDLKRQRESSYNYRVNFPDSYTTPNLFITKFERDYDPQEQIQRKDRGRPLTYQFINSYPISILTMPVSYDSSSLLKCTISFTYSRYVLSRDPAQFTVSSEPSDPVSNTSPAGIVNRFGPAFGTNEEADRQLRILRGEDVR